MVIFRSDQVGSQLQHGTDQVRGFIHGVVHHLHRVGAELTEAPWWTATHRSVYLHLSLRSVWAELERGQDVNGDNWTSSLQLNHSRKLEEQADPRSFDHIQASHLSAAIQDFLFSNLDFHGESEHFERY